MDIQAVFIFSTDRRRLNWFTHAIMWFLTFKKCLRWWTPLVSEHLGSCHIFQMQREQVLTASFSQSDPWAIVEQRRKWQPKGLQGCEELWRVVKSCEVCEAPLGYCLLEYAVNGNFELFNPINVRPRMLLLRSPLPLAGICALVWTVDISG